MAGEYPRLVSHDGMGLLRAASDRYVLRVEVSPRKFVSVYIGPAFMKRAAHEDGTVLRVDATPDEPHGPAELGWEP